MKKCNSNVKKAIELAKKLLILSNDGMADSEDDSCRVLYGIIRDCSYRIHSQAVREQKSHIRQNIWK